MIKFILKTGVFLAGILAIFHFVNVKEDNQYILLNAREEE